MTDTFVDDRPLITLDQYKSPSTPATDTALGLFARFKPFFGKDDDAPMMACVRLQETSSDVLSEFVGPPDCATPRTELAADLSKWMGLQHPASRMRLIVIPPCNDNDVIASWASDQGHQILTPPNRRALIDDGLNSIGELPSKGLIVIPKLERWFIRHESGLVVVRELLGRLKQSQVRVVVGCNRSAWSYLSRMAGAAMILPTPVTFRPFDAERLEEWFEELATNESTDPVSFRLSGSGETILSSKDDSTADDYFSRLAAHSLGIPWVAWHLWRRSIRTKQTGNSKVAQSKSRSKADLQNEQKTLWVAALQDYILPNRHEQDARLILQALLIHGSLSHEELSLVLPLMSSHHVLAGLVGAGFVEDTTAGLRCAAAAYPSIHAGLLAAGFPTDELK